MGTVFEVIDSSTNRRLALKTLKTLSPDHAILFKREFRTLAGLRHPNLVKLHELHWPEAESSPEGAVETPSRPFFTMDLIDGVSFEEYVTQRLPDEIAGFAPARRRQPVEATQACEKQLSLSSGPRKEPTRGGWRRGEAQHSPEAAQAVVPDETQPYLPNDRLQRRTRRVLARFVEPLLGVVSALSHLHTSRRVHCDIKPSNIIVNEHGEAFVVDFGVTADLTKSRQSSGAYTTGGTATYMAPEHRQDSEPTPALDWYALGTVLYRAFAGGPPYEGTRVEVAMLKALGDPPRLLSRNPFVPEWVDELVMGLLARDPAERWGSERVANALLSNSVNAPTARFDVVDDDAGAATRFVGRKNELLMVWQSIDTVKQGPRQINVSGPTGIGKSAFLFGATSRYTRANSRVLALMGRCRHHERLRFKGMDEIVDQLAQWMIQRSDEVQQELGRDIEGRDTLLKMMPGFQAVWGTPGPTSFRDPPARRRRAFAAFWEVVRRCTELKDIVFVVDDCQWMDSDTRTLLESYRDLEAPVRAVFVFAYRSHAHRSLPLSVRDGHFGERTRIELRGLADEDVRSVIERTTSDPVLRTRALDASKRLGGHPQHLVETLRLLDAFPDSVIPDALDEVFRIRISALRKEARDVLETICIARSSLSVGVIFAVQSMSSETFRAALNELEQAMLVSVRTVGGDIRYEPAHDRTREYMRGAISDETAAGWHRRLVEATEGLSYEECPAVDRFVHLAALGDWQAALQEGWLAASDAREQFAFQLEAQILMTLADSNEVSVDYELAFGIARALHDSGQGKIAAQWFNRAAEVSAGETRLECRRRAAQNLVVTGHLDEGVALGDSVLRELGLPTIRSKFRVYAQFVLLRGRFERALNNFTPDFDLQLTSEQRLKIETYRLLGMDLSMVDSARAMVYQYREAIMALELGHPPSVAKAVSTQAAMIAIRGTEASEAIARALSVARGVAVKLDDPVYVRWVDMLDGACAYHEGRFSESVRTVEEAYNWFLEHRPEERSLIGKSELYRCVTRRYLGELNELRVSSKTAIADARARGDLFIETCIAAGSVWLWLADDDTAGADERIRTLPWEPPTTSYHIQHYQTARARTEVALYRGANADELIRLLEEFKAFNRSMLRRVFQLTRVQGALVEGRLCLALALKQPKKRAKWLRKARKHLKVLKSEDPPYVPTWRAVLEVSLYAVEGDAEAMETAARQALVESRRTDQKFFEMFVALRADELMPSAPREEVEALMLEAQRWSAHVGVVDPLRFSRTVLVLPEEPGGRLV